MFYWAQTKPQKLMRPGVGIYLVSEKANWRGPLRKPLTHEQLPVGGYFSF
jgi:hypothetical protein